MNDWTAGYVADITYTYGYYTELNPLRIRPALLFAGFVPPPVTTACELGFGQGMSINLHAAASTVSWWGTDFNPSQAAFAQELAQVAGSGAHLFDQAFADFCAREDVPDFDYIGLHGIWSWISDENRRVIVDFVQRKLKVGGVLYISYNTHPGWAAFVPLRELLTAHAELLGAKGAGIVRRIDGALAFAEQLFSLNPLFARANPPVVERLKKMKEQNRHYLAHEFFNRDWHPMSVRDMGEWLAAAKLSFACSAHLLDAVDAIHLTLDQQKLLNDIPDTIFRQLVRDFCVHQQFRRDYWMKGPRRLSVLEQAEVLRHERVILIQPRADVSLKVTGSLGEATLQETVYGPILDVLADHKPKTVGEIERTLRGGTEAARAVTFAQLVQAVTVLMGSGAVAPAQDEATIQKVKKRTDRLNRHLMQLARTRHELGYLASPVTGGGIAVPRFHQLFLQARSQGHKEPQDWAREVWNLLAAQGQRLVKEGKTLETPEENLAELTAQAAAFAEKPLRVLQALGIA